MNDKIINIIYWILFIGVVLFAVLACVSCMTPTTATPTTATPTTATPTTTIIKSVDDSCIRIWIDPETNIQYIIYHNRIGYAGLGGITPRLNEDGSLYVAPIEKERN